MQAMVINEVGPIGKNQKPLKVLELPRPQPLGSEILIKVSVCGVCHTELDEIEGRTPPSRFPMIPGHQVVGKVVQLGPEARRFKVGDRVGVAWIYHACGYCLYCLSDRENLCADFQATGRDAHGGYAEYMKVGEEFCYAIPAPLSDREAAPLLCAGAIGYRSLHLSGLKEGGILGLTGFGASAHLVLKMAQHRFPDSRFFVFARNPQERSFALELGAAWSGDTGDMPPELMDAIIDTTPAWKPVVRALRCLKPGGRLVINAIRKESSDLNSLLELDYTGDLWMEKEIKSVANVTRRDVQEFLELAGKMGLKPHVQVYLLEQANQALLDLKFGDIRGAKVLVNGK